MYLCLSSHLSSRVSLASALSTPTISRNNSVNLDLSSTNDPPSQLSNPCPSLSSNPRPSLSSNARPQPTPPTHNKAPTSAPSSPGHRSKDRIHSQLSHRKRHSSMPASLTDGSSSSLHRLSPMRTQDSVPTLPSDRSSIFSPMRTQDSVPILSSDRSSIFSPMRTQDSVPAFPSDRSSRFSPMRTRDSVPASPSDRSSYFSHQFSPRKAQLTHESRTRQYYGQNSSYIMDAKTKGNIGRYINVSVHV